MLLIDSTQTLPLLASPRITTPSLQPNSKQQMIRYAEDTLARAGLGVPKK